MYLTRCTFLFWDVSSEVNHVGKNWPARTGLQELACKKWTALKFEAKLQQTLVLSTVI